MSTWFWEIKNPTQFQTLFSLIRSGLVLLPRCKKICVQINFGCDTKIHPPVIPAMLIYLFGHWWCGWWTAPSTVHDACRAVVCEQCARAQQEVRQQSVCACVCARAHLAPRCHSAMERGEPHAVFGVDSGPCSVETWRTNTALMTSDVKFRNQTIKSQLTQVSSTFTALRRTFWCETQWKETQNTNFY